MKDALNQELEQNLIGVHVVCDSRFRRMAERAIPDFDGGTGAVEALVIVFVRERM